jgi:hypothetical protein
MDPETALIVASLHNRMDGQRKEQLRELLAGSVDWNRVLVLMERHRVPGLVLRGIDSLADSLVPASVLAHLRARSREIHARNLVLTAELLACLDRLAAAGIEAVPYKGPVLGAAAYGDPGSRISHDLDIVVRPSDAPRAFEVLTEGGYRMDHAISPKRADRFYRLHYHHGFRGRGGVHLELHWAFLPRYYRFAETPNSIWHRRTMVEVGGRRVPHFAPEDLLLILAAHGYKHLWSRLELVCAVAQLLEAHSDIDWKPLAVRARALGLGRVLGLACRLASEIFDAPVPEELRPNAFGDPDAARCARIVDGFLFADARRPGLWGRTRFRLMARERVRDRVGYCAGLVTQVDDWRAWPRDPRWAPLEQAQRWLRIVRMTRGGRAAGSARQGGSR